MENQFAFAVILFTLVIIAFVNILLVKRVQTKENLLKFSDIEIEQSRQELDKLKKELSFVVTQNNILQDKLIDSNNMLFKCNESRDHWRERALHKKHTKKVVDSDNWKCINKHYRNFNNGTTYKIDSSQTPTSNSLLFLICDDNKSYLVEKKYFQPVN